MSAQTKSGLRKTLTCFMNTPWEAKPLVFKYVFLDAVQLPFLKAFWALEQRKSRIQDQLANRETLR